MSRYVTRIRARKVLARSLVVCVVAGLMAAVTAPAKPSDIVRARNATGLFQKLSVAKKHGYGLLRDAKKIACIDKRGEGGMGIHYANSDLVGDGAVKLTTPDVLVYQPLKNGRMKLVALEYVVFQSAWDKKHAHPPSLYGHEFELIPAGNRYGLPPFYELHAWVWKHNPSGRFGDWNPRVVC
ncbi:MAG: hypothetical protein QOI98_461 [Solirubrobacteraceae bacterium]|nr:hypothetical protein [Solirubrobacteraceae bacterium]